VPEVINSATGLPKPEALDQKYLRSMADMGVKRLDDYGIAERYYLGDQQTLLTDRARTYLQRSGLPYNENFCQTVVDSLGDRLRVVGLSTPEFPDLAGWLWERIWDKNRLDAEQHRFHTELLKYGDLFVMVDWDAEKTAPRVRLNYPDMVRADYEDGVCVRVVKVWDTDSPSPVNPANPITGRGANVKRMNIYRYDRIERYYKAGNADGDLWAPWIEDGDTVFPLPNYAFDNPALPRGLPAFHFANTRQRNCYGIAEHRGVIPQQDRLNKELVDLSLVLDTLGFPQRYAAGIAAGSLLRSVPGEVWSSEDPNVSFGQFPAADPAGLISAIESTLSRIAARSRTPAHLLLLSGGVPSGESLKTAESGLVAKAKARQYEWGEAWSSVIRYAALLALEFGAPGDGFPITREALLDTPINVEWADAVSRNEKEHLETLTMMSALGVSQRTLLSKLEGIDPMTEVGNNAEELEGAQGALSTALDRGGAGLA